MHTWDYVTQKDSIRGCLKLIIINRVIIYRWKRNLSDCVFCNTDLVPGCLVCTFSFSFWFLPVMLTVAFANTKRPSACVYRHRETNPSIFCKPLTKFLFYRQIIVRSVIINSGSHPNDPPCMSLTYCNEIRLTIDGICIGNRICWTLTERNYE
jgi:hypothetical protein